jgi:hypothetical protein
MENIGKAKNNDKRLKPRKPYSGHIFFSSDYGVHEGRLKNYSRYGLFIETTVSLPIGETITIALPYMNGKQTKVKGQIVRCNQEGFGIELFRKRKDTYLKLIK